MTADTPSPAEIVDRVLDTMMTLYDADPERVIAALSEHYHLLPKAEVEGPDSLGNYTIPVKTRRPQDNPHIRIEPVNPWGERVMHPLAVPQPFRDPDLARGFAAALASAADVAEETR
ncbi:hypothetical protein KNU54_gp09 [Gordonia phage VanDeWege]|uniref:Uncharacterized protein n=1 Tax=Gordonia phage VanDeWege TaxID=2588131 RepID=A0A4Y5TZW6_9CAUD|nr:hypothetical protein KNU54_gp09 [Gordonia phage VanDeWege]QDB74591.1 hypothetical protein SEA_VANDEWEGE_9 [Gordonia phage VanDeWege]